MSYFIIKFLVVSQLYSAWTPQLYSLWSNFSLLNTDSTTGAEITFGVSLGDSAWQVVFQPYLKTAGYPEQPTKLWKNSLAGDFRRAYLSYNYRGEKLDVMLKLGRDSIRIGPTGIFLSSNGAYLDMFFIKGKVAPIWDAEMVWGTTILTGLDSNNRYLSFHGIEFHPTGSFRMGWAESVIYGGHSALPIPYYLNPLTLYYSYQVFSESPQGIRTNVGWDLWVGGDVKGWDWAAELFIDDYPYKPAYNEKGMLAWGMYVGKDARNMRLKFSYRGATRWTYTHKGGFTRYVVGDDVPLGDSLGNDFDRFAAEFTIQKRRMRFWLIFALTRKGEGTLDERPPRSTDWPDKTFLTGTVERKVEVGGGIALSFLRDKAFLEAKAIPSYITNYAHQEGQDRFLVKWLLQAGFRPL